MSQAPSTDVGNRNEMDGTNTVATDTTRGLETIAPMLDFTEDEESAVLDRQNVELVTDSVRLAGNAEIKLDLVPLFIPSFYYQMTPKIPLNTRCSICISKNLSINGRTRSSDQLGIWSYNINP